MEIAHMAHTQTLSMTPLTSHSVFLGRTLGICCWLCLAVLFFATSPLSWGQQTREAEIERQRDQKAANPGLDKPDKVERALDWAEDDEVLERLTVGYYGWNLRFGGLIQGSGFGLGPEYRRNSDFLGGNTFRVGAQLSTKLYQKYYTRWTLPHIARNHLAVDFIAVHRNYSEVDYFGPGPKSLESQRTDYRYEDTGLDASVGVKPVKHLQLGGSAGYLWANVGPGKSDRYPSSELVFSPSVAPGIDQQTDFLRYGPYIQVDYLDNADIPTNGGLYTFQYTRYRDQKLGLYGFNRMDAEVQQYFGFFNNTRVIAFRAKATLTDAESGQVVPFYMQAILGGSEDLRGFKPFRFYDNNSFLMNLEYRWHLVSTIDMAVFADGGKVFPRRGQLNFSNLEGDGGIGFRFNIKGRQFMRIDVAGSHEGFQIWLKFNDIFARQPVGSASAQPLR
jgi:Omp85 superfamily domain